MNQSVIKPIPSDLKDLYSRRQLALANGKSLKVGQLIARPFCAKEYGICRRSNSEGYSTSEQRMDV
jgi:hypothetical protein